MTEMIPVPVISLRIIGPAAVLAVTGFVLMLLDLLPPRGRREHLAFVGLGGVVIALIATILLWGSDTTGFQGMAILDNLALFGTLVIGRSEERRVGKECRCRWREATDEEHNQQIYHRQAP